MCNCYVQTLSDETQFALHWGAHSPECPKYRVSLDPVDRASDDRFRATYEIPAPAIMSVPMLEAAPTTERCWSACVGGL